MKRLLTLFLAFLSTCSAAAAEEAPYAQWNRSGSLFILTTPEGADLPASAVVEEFPLLVRLHRDGFDFSQARPDGADLRFASREGKPLPYQIERWDAVRGEAAVWVRIPKIQGNARQELRVYWGNPQAASESSGRAVFDASNGYESVWHLGDAVEDAVGTLVSKDAGTLPVEGVVAGARRLPGGKGVFGGDKIADYPAGDAAHSSQAWFRAERPNATILGWGIEGGGRGGKVRMQLRSPPHLHIDSAFCDVDAPERLPLQEWVHVVHTHASGVGRIYVNGRLVAEAKTPLSIKSPARLWLGGWYGHYDFVGELDEVRISSVARSAEWIRLEYENQKALPTLVGSIVAPAEKFALSAAAPTVKEGGATTLAAQTGGAMKVYWSVLKGGREEVVAVDRSRYVFEAGRVSGDVPVVVRVKAVYADGVKTTEAPLRIVESIPDPVVALEAPAKWNGRDPVQVKRIVRNLDLLKSAGSGELKTRWTVRGGAVLKTETPDALVLERSQYTGTIHVEAAVDGGGGATVAAASIEVEEPAKDAWVVRAAGDDEKPVDGQFYARDDRGEGTLYYNGTLGEAAESVFLRVYADDRLLTEKAQAPAAGGRYAFSVKLKPQLVRYRVEFGVKNGGVEKVLHTVRDLLCGDAYLITGQSNAVADVKDHPETSPWIRSFGNMGGGAGKGWTPAVRGSVSGDLGRIGYWGFDLAKALVERRGVPICILNGAVGGTRIDQHQPTAENHADPQTIYGRLHARVVEARLTHGVRGIFWYQGENNQGAASPSGEEDWKAYPSYFVDLAAAWKRDYPNVRNYYVFQFWPNACAMGGTRAGDMTGEAVRSLPKLFSNLRAVSVTGIDAPDVGKGNCHFTWQGYAEIAKLVLPAVEFDQYGVDSGRALASPNLQRAYYTTAARDEVALEFDQPMEWNDAAKALLYLDDAPAPVRAGKAEGNRVLLSLAAPAEARTVTYLKGKDWDGSRAKLLFGVNRTAALTFCEVPLEAR